MIWNEFRLIVTFDILVRAGFTDADNLGEERKESSIPGWAEDDRTIVWHKGARDLHPVELGWTLAVDCYDRSDGFLQS